MAWQAFFHTLFSSLPSGDSHSDSRCYGVPPKSPDHSDVNTSRISTQTHQEAHSLKTSEDAWRYRPLLLGELTDNGADSTTAD